LKPQIKQKVNSIKDSIVLKYPRQNEKNKKEE
jgi:hypothetical protein